MNAIDYLIEEHISHRNLLDNIEDDNSLYPKFRKEFIHHVNMEEVILYPGLLKVPELEMIVREAWEEHSLLMQLVQEMDELDRHDKKWISKFGAFKKLLLLHLEDEEKLIFPKVRQLAPPKILDELGKEMFIQKVSTPTEKIIYPEEPDSHKLQS